MLLRYPSTFDKLVYGNNSDKRRFLLGGQRGVGAVFDLHCAGGSQGHEVVPDGGGDFDDLRVFTQYDLFLHIAAVIVGIGGNLSLQNREKLPFRHVAVRSDHGIRLADHQQPVRRVIRGFVQVEVVRRRGLAAASLSNSAILALSTVFMMSFSYGDFLNVPRDTVAFNRENHEKKQQLPFPGYQTLECGARRACSRSAGVSFSSAFQSHLISNGVNSGLLLLFSRFTVFCLGNIQWLRPI